MNFKDFVPNGKPIFSSKINFISQNRSINENSTLIGYETNVPDSGSWVNVKIDDKPWVKLFYETEEQLIFIHGDKEKQPLIVDKKNPHVKVEFLAVLTGVIQPIKDVL